MTVFLYAGQGSQFPGMGKDLYEQYPVYRNVIDRVKLEFDHKKLMHEGPEETLRQTCYTQPCMAAFAAGVTEVLKENGITPDAAAGLSLGEYSALYAAGVWDLDTFIRIVDFRGKTMQQAAKGIDTAMSAIIGPEREIVEDICIKASDPGFVTVANYNCPGQYVICGEESSVNKAEEKLKAGYNARCVRLNTSGPFHTEYMKKAGNELNEMFGNICFNKPSIPTAHNVTGKMLQEGEDLKDLLVRQVYSSVRFEDCIKSLLEDGASLFLEIGPGNVLSSLVKKTARAMKARPEIMNIQTADDLRKVIERL